MADNKKNMIKILAIETSCDETAAAVITAASYEITPLHSSSYAGQANLTKVQNYQSTNQRVNKSTINYPVILSNVVSSQIDLHKITGGIVPEVASRAHVESIIPVVHQALLDANSKSKDSCHSRLDRESIQMNPRVPPVRRAGKPEDDKSKELQATPLRSSSYEGQACYKLQANLLSQITHLAVTVGPGLVGSLMVGVDTAKSLAYALGVPIISINHIEGHIYSAMSGANSKSQTLNSKQIQNNNDQNSKQFGELENCNLDIISDLGFRKLEFPLIALTVSGGHTSLTLMKDHGVYETLGQTRDDAAGEAFDKVAKLLGLGYPGGPAVSKLASKHRNRISNDQFSISKQIQNIKSQKSNIQTNYLQANPYKLRPKASTKGRSASGGDQPMAETPKAYNLVFPRPMIKDDNFDFSFSGLKTAVLQKVIELRAPTKLQIKRKYKSTNNYQSADQPINKLTNIQKQEIAFAFEEAVVDVLVSKTIRAVAKYKPKTVVLAGGVAANRRLRERLAEKLDVTTRTDTDYVEQITNAKQSNRSTNQQINNINLLIPSINLCGDNAAMIGLAAYYHIVQGDISTWDKVNVNTEVKL